MLDTTVRKHVQVLFDWLAIPLIKLKFSPTRITLVAFFVGILCPLCLVFSHFSFSWRVVSLCLLAFSGLLDVLDGTIARATHRTSQLGAFLDLILDRVVECVFIIVQAALMPQSIWAGMIFLALMTINFSTFLLADRFFSSSGEKSMHYDIGLVERSETFILFGLILLIPSLSTYLLWIFNALMALTAILRIKRITRIARDNNLDGRIRK